jgi:hypothetical protein
VTEIVVAKPAVIGAPETWREGLRLRSRMAANGTLSCPYGFSTELACISYLLQPLWPTSILAEVRAAYTEVFAIHSCTTIYSDPDTEAEYPIRSAFVGV